MAFQKGHVVPENIRKKISNTLKGRTFSKEHLAKISKSLTGKKASEETKEKQRQAKLKNPVRYWLGKKRVNLTGKNNPRWMGGYERKLWSNRQRRIKRLGNGGSHTFEEWEDLKKKFDYICKYCNKKEPEIKLTVDHIIPLSKGGSDNIDNLQPLCRNCNAKKYNKIVL